MAACDRPDQRKVTAAYDAAWYDTRWRSLSDDQRVRAVAIVKASLEGDERKRIQEKHARHGGDWIHHLIDLDPEMQDDAFAVGLVSSEQATLSGHHGFGTYIRNRLRTGAGVTAGIPDEELPDAPYPDGSQQRTWDDYYVQAIEAALGLRA
jgi:hypothetical protein